MDNELARCRIFLQIHVFIAAAVAPGLYDANKTKKRWTINATASCSINGSELFFHSVTNLIP